MRKEDKQSDTAYLYASEKERYDAQLRSLRAQADAKKEETEEAERNKQRSQAAKEEVKGEVDSLEQLGVDLEATVARIEETISDKRLHDEVIVQTNAQVEKVEKLRKDKISV